MQYLKTDQDVIVVFSDAFTILDTADPDRKDLVADNGNRFNGVDWTKHGVVDGPDLTPDQLNKARRLQGSIIMGDLANIDNIELTEEPTYDRP